MAARLISVVQEVLKSTRRPDAEIIANSFIDFCSIPGNELTADEMEDSMRSRLWQMVVSRKATLSRIERAEERRGFKRRLTDDLETETKSETQYDAFVSSMKTVPEEQGHAALSDTLAGLELDDIKYCKICPAYLWCSLRIIHEDENFIAFNKPWDYRIDRRVVEEPGFVGEPTIQNYFTKRFPDIAVRFCHQLGNIHTHIHINIHT